MNKIKLSFLLLITILSNYSYANWIDLNTGINDELTGVVFRGDTGFVSGRGIYFTTNGGNGTGSWTKYVIPGTSSDALIYNASKFTHCYSIKSDINNVYFCGRDTVQNKAVIFQFSMLTFTHNILYIGSIGSALNNIDYSILSNEYYSVGENGLIVKFNDGVAGTEISTPLTQNLKAISFKNGSFWIAANGYKIFGIDNNPGFTITSNDIAPVNIKDVLMLTDTSGYGVGDKLYSNSGGVIQAFTNYDFGPLNANCVYEQSANYYVGTDHGIFRNTASSLPSINNPFEFELNTSNYNIHEFWIDSSSIVYAYACGNNGIVLRQQNSLNSGTKPYVSILPNSGACESGYCTLYDLLGSALSGQWYFNGVLYNPYNDNYISHTFNSPGIYQVMFVGFNFFSSDTAYTTVTVTAKPEINKPTFLTDSILCHQESIEVNIDSSQATIYYSLYDYRTHTFHGSSGIGNGGSISFTSSVLSDSGYYYLVATSAINSACKSNFTDSIHIAAEKTHADFHVSHINCEAGESVYFYEKSKDADNFKWTFDSNATTATSSLAEPINTFSAAALPQPIELIVWSDHGCYDTIVKNGPRVVIEPTTIDSSWVNGNDSPIAPYGDDPYIMKMIPLSDGYIIVGKSYKEKMGSRFGDSTTINGLNGITIGEDAGVGGYLIKYDYRGMLKWKVYTASVINDVVADNKGNIYFCGSEKLILIDNKNDTTIYPNNIYGIGCGYIVKIDSLGRRIWDIVTASFVPYRLSIDKSGNILSSGWLSLTSDSQFYLNGELTDTLGLIGLGELTIKLSPFGEVLWEVSMDLDISNYNQFQRVSTDNLNNVYVTGGYKIGLTTHTTDHPGGIYMGGGSPLLYEKLMFLTKLDSAGNLLWQTRGDVFSANKYTEIYDMVTDGEGYTYITGQNGSDSVTQFVYYNVNGTTSSVYGGSYFIMKIDPNGNCIWIKTEDYTSYGEGAKLILDNDKIYVIGWIKDSSPWDITHPTAKFLNEDETGFLVDIDPSNYFMAEYDTSGYLLSLIKNSNDGDAYYSNGIGLTFTGFFKYSNDSSFYLSRNIRLHFASTIYNEMGHPKSTVDQDTWVIKFKPGNGIRVPKIYFHEDQVSICQGETYVFPSGDSVVVNGVEGDTLSFVAQNGMDSLVVTRVNMIPSSYAPVGAPMCYGGTITYPDGTVEVITDTTSHTSILTSTFGCDSTIYTVVYIVGSPTSTLYDTICIGSQYTFPDGQVQNIDSALVHTSTLSSYLGCDSLVYSHVFVKPKSTINLYDTICTGTNYLFPDGHSELITNSIIDTSILISSTGCDSSVIMHLNVFQNIVASITQLGNVLAAEPAALDYQWLMCNNGYQVISGENAQVIVPQNSTSYAVIINNNICFDTSNCFMYESLSINENGSKNDTIAIYPNPATNQITIKTNSSEPFDIRIYNTYGEIILYVQNVNSEMPIGIQQLAKGFYLLEVGLNHQFFPLIKN